MKPDLIKIVLLVLAAIILGWTFGFAFEFGLVTALACNVWLLYRAKRLHNWFSNTKELPHAEQGVFYLLHRDIKTMREKHKKQKRLLQHNLKRVREASAALPDAVIITNNNGEITWSNKLAAELLNIQHPRDDGHRINNLLRNPSFTAAYEKHNKKPVNIDIEAPTNRNLTINVKVINLAKNMQMVVARDISRHVNTNRAQKDFVSNVSHELKTPLTVMRGYLEIIEDDKDINSKPIADMLLQTKRMQSTIEDLLYLAKLESKSELELKANNREAIVIKQILEMFMDSAQLLAEQNNQTIKIEVDEKLTINGNPSELQIAFSNLVTNAIRYTPEGGNIHIQWLQREDEAIFAVTDTGIGIAPNHISRLTERFYRVDQGRSRAKGGTGLGLAIVKHVLERHNAKLSIISQLGHGSCFECVFSIDA